jgi:hypothetical protein
VPRCSHTYEDSSQCRRIVSAEQEYCYSHDPARASERKRNAARGGRAKASGELGRVKARLHTWRIWSKRARWTVQTPP